MKEVKHYICELCNTEYNEKSKAQSCEKSHIETLAIERCKYLPMHINNSAYPQSISVIMADGKTVTYKR